jgi:hemerythrin-like domain-containing protein
MAAALESAAQDPIGARITLRRKADAYIRLLREHIQKEDDVLFVLADGVLGSEDQKRLVREFEEHEASEIGPDFHEKYLEIAQNLSERTV